MMTAGSLKHVRLCSHSNSSSLICALHNTLRQGFVGWCVLILIGFMACFRGLAYVGLFKLNFQSR